MKDIDQKIQAALQRDQAADLGGEPNIAEEALAAFRGHHRWFSTLLVLKTAVIAAGFLWCAVRFCQATDVSAQLRWGGAAIALMMIIALIKIWFWMEMQTNRLLREVKRVELMVVSHPQR
jgi:hypothetical protein